MKLTHDAQPDIEIEIDCDGYGGSLKGVIMQLDIAYNETRAALAAMYGKPVPVHERFAENTVIRTDRPESITSPFPRD